MKTTFLGVFFALSIFTMVVTPHGASALSCLDPAGMIEYYVSDPDYVVFTATAGEQVEYVKEKATEEFLQDSGYTGQYIEVDTVYKGYPENKQWVYWQKDATWGYLCAGAPPEEGAEALYIISQPHGVFDLPQVVNVYAVDSTFATDIIAALSQEDTETVEVGPEEWQNRLRTDLKEMIFLIRVKLAEFRWWLGQ